MDINLNNLKSLESLTNIKIFKNNYIIRNKIKIINDCNKNKKKKLLELINDLKYISNRNIDIDIDLLKNTQDNAMKDIVNYNNIISIVNNLSSINNNYIEVYGNY
jgi:hypothetical protein